MKSKKNLFAAVLSLLLIFTFVPVGAAFAAEAEAELYRLDVDAQSDYYVTVWFDGELQPGTSGGSYYIPAGTTVEVEWEGCYLIRTSDLSDCEWWASGMGHSVWAGAAGFTMPARSTYLSFSHR